MAQQDKRWDKPILVDTRDLLIHFLDRAGYNGPDIADLFAVNRSTVHRVLKEKHTPWLERKLKKTIRK